MGNSIVAYVKGLLERRRAEHELDEEVRFHLDMETQANIERGMTRAAARRRAMIEFGGVLQTREHVRALRHTWLDALSHDIRFAVRSLRRSPGFSLTVFATLAIAIGFSSAVFTMVNAVLLRPLPYRDPDRLVAVWQVSGPHLRRGISTPEDLRFMRENNSVFEDLAGAEVAEKSNRVRFDLERTDGTRRVMGAAVTPNMFGLLGCRPALGRTFGADDVQHAGGKVVVLSDALWRSEFGGNRDVIGQQLRLTGERYTVVGVMPAEFKFTYPAATELWVPSVNVPEAAGALLYDVTARLKPGVTVAQAQAAMDRLRQQRIREEPRSRWKSTELAVVPLHEDIVGDTRPVLALLAAGVGFVLLIACVNISNLLLARATSRARDMGVRAALGASRLSLVRQMLTESGLLALGGSAGGVLFAAWVISAVKMATPASIPRADEIRMDHTAVLCGFALAALSALLFGLVPALRASCPNVGESLKNSGNTSTATSVTLRLRGALVVAEVSLVAVLLVCAGLTINSLLRLWAVPLGFQPSQVLAVKVPLPPKYWRLGDAGERDQRLASATVSLLNRLTVLPGVQHAAASSAIPLRDVDYLAQFGLDGPAVTGPHPTARLRMVSPDFFRALGIPVVRGRPFTERDVLGGKRVTVVNEAFARAFLATTGPLGRHMVTGVSDSDVEVVGVAGDARFGKAGEAQVEPAIYLPYVQSPVSRVWFLLRVARDPAEVAQEVRKAIRGVDSEIPVEAVVPLERVVADAQAELRFRAVSLGLFALVVVLLAAVGIYGVISFAVSQRVREIGVRLALGAGPSPILRMVLWNTATWVVGGMALGLAAAAATSRLLAALLFRVEPLDPATFAEVVAILALVALAAAWWPAWRATRIDPLNVLRAE